MKKLQTISQNSLEELQSMVGAIEQVMHDYLHVAEHLPHKIVNDLSAFSDKIIQEIERREDEAF